MFVPIKNSIIKERSFQIELNKLPYISDFSISIYIFLPHNIREVRNKKEF